MERVDGKVEILNRLIREVKVKMSEEEVGLEKEITSEIEILKETLEYLEDERDKLLTEEEKEVKLTLEELSGERILYITDKWR